MVFQSLKCTQMELLRIIYCKKKINVNGGACVLDHPLGASGARIIVTLIHAMINRNAKKGITAICLGGEKQLPSL